MRWLTSILGLMLVAAGCADTVAGSARPAPSLADVLPAAEETTSAVGNRLDSYGFAPFIGGVEVMPDGFRTDDEASPIACIGVTDTMVRVVYEQVPVVEAARQSYFSLAPGVKVSGADAAVIRLATAEAAETSYTEFTRQWQRCDGQTVVKRLRGTTKNELSATISDVAVSSATTSATVTVRDRRTGQTSRFDRAIGLRADDIAEVSLAVTATGEERPATGTAAVELVEVMLAKAG